MFRPTYADINLEAIRQNASVLRDLNPGGWLCPMVKADAYGHGAVEVVRTLLSMRVSAVGVACVEEALQLRQAGFHQIEILVFGCFSSSAAQACFEHHLTPVVSRWEDLEFFRSLSSGLQLHLKFNTGMNRLGFSVTEGLALADFLTQNPHLSVKGFCSHLYQGDDWGVPGGTSARQLQSFFAVVQDLNEGSKALYAQGRTKPLLHILNSAALLRLRLESRQVGVKAGGPSLGSRPGIALYGAGRTDLSTIRVPLVQAMHLRSQIVVVHQLKAGQSVSYGAQWRASQDSTVGVLPLGYADGIFRLLSNKGVALVRGKRVPMIGMVCMDYVMLDLTALNQERPVLPGESVTLFGEQEGVWLSADEVAQHAQTISYEVFTAVSSRVPRVYQEKSGS